MELGLCEGHGGTLELIIHPSTYLLIHSGNILNIYYMPGILLGAGDTNGEKVWCNSCLQVLIVWKGVGN